ncbi:TIM barrel protein [Candidatus Pelagibacter sp.]|nr:TIM barrel protein [Candidatus Pelagibacter sp.]
MIYISTGGFRNLKPQSVIKKLSRIGIKSIELSGGSYDEEKKIIKFLKKNKDLNYSLHNYFPVPKKHFVINLASVNKKVFKQSLLNIKKSINISSQFKSNYFSFHSGFLFDPNFKFLGKSFDKVKLQNRKKTMELFMRRVNLLAKEAKKKKVKILIENNVITKNNYKRFKQNPLLLTHPVEIVKFFKRCDKNVRLLLDVGHLKVSSKTEGFDLFKGHEMLKPYIEGYHLSDNNGLKDSNSEFTKKSWFYNNLKKDVKYISIEVYIKNLRKLKTMLNIVKKKYDN